MFARESIDLTSPSATLALKMRLHDAQNALTKHGAMLSKYCAGPDADDIEVEAELRRIKTTQAMRAKSVVSISMRFQFLILVFIGLSKHTPKHKTLAA